MNTRIFRRLRLEIVAIGVCMMLVMMIAVCITVYFSMAATLKANSIEVLDYTAELVLSELASAQTQSVPSQPTDDSTMEASDSTLTQTTPVQPKSMDMLLFRNVLVAYLDKTGYIVTVKQGNRAIEHIELMGKEIPDIDRFKTESQGIITLNDADYRYKHIVYKDQQILLLISRSGELANLPSLMNILLTVGTVSMLVLILITFILVSIIIQPISKAWKTQQQFLHDASHELKTPLAVIATNIEAVRASPDETVASQDKWLRYVAEETEDMRKLVNDMLALALSNHPDSQLNNKPFVPFNLSDAVTEAGLIIEANALEAGIELELDVENDLWTVGYREGIKRVLLILLDNALKNTFEGGKITLELHRYRNELYASCTNTGHGIPKDELKNIFKRFYRLDSSRARQSGGTGLGLSIAEGAIESHGGKIWAESEPEQYARFTFKLSACPPPDET